jgi:hypothetical protein
MVPLASDMGIAALGEKYRRTKQYLIQHLSIVSHYSSNVKWNIGHRLVFEASKWLYNIMASLRSCRRGNVAPPDSS